VVATIDGNIPLVDDVCRLLMAEEAIEEATPGQQFRSKSVSPELQLFLSNQSADGFKLLARKLDSMQEVRLEWR
jgi:hypothetical protein